MARLVHAADGREWILHRRLTWRTALPSEEFEHELAGSSKSAIALAGVLVLLVVVLIAWMPSSVVIPGWMGLILVLALVVFLLSWALGRPWMLIAETDGDHDRRSEYWMGTVRGVLRSRQQLSRVARELEEDSLPRVEGPLHQVD